MKSYVGVETPTYKFFILSCHVLAKWQNDKILFSQAAHGVSARTSVAVMVAINEVLGPG